MATTRARERAASGCAGILDAELFKALCEPVRVEIVRLLIAHGRSDLSSLAAELPQDPSVISRHLAVLHRAGLVRRAKRGRHVYFELDGPDGPGGGGRATAGFTGRRTSSRYRRAWPTTCATGSGSGTRTSSASTTPSISNGCAASTAGPPHAA